MMRSRWHWIELRSVAAMACTVKYDSHILNFFLSSSHHSYELNTHVFTTSAAQAQKHAQHKLTPTSPYARHPLTLTLPLPAEISASRLGPELIENGFLHGPLLLQQRKHEEKGKGQWKSPSPSHGGQRTKSPFHAPETAAST